MIAPPGGSTPPVSNGRRSRTQFQGIRTTDTFNTQKLTGNSKADQPYRIGRYWLKTKIYTASDAVAGAVIGPRSRPRQLVLGLYDSTGRLRVAGRTGPLASAQATAIAPFLHAPTGGHPWPEEVTPRWFGQFARDTEPVHLTLVEPVAVEVSADAARTGIAFRHLVRFIRPRPDTDPTGLRAG